MDCILFSLSSRDTLHFMRKQKITFLHAVLDTFIYLQQVSTESCVVVKSRTLCLKNNFYRTTVYVQYVKSSFQRKVGQNFIFSNEISVLYKFIYIFHFFNVFSFPMSCNYTYSFLFICSDTKVNGSSNRNISIFSRYYTVNLF